MQHTECTSKPHMMGTISSMNIYMPPLLYSRLRLCRRYWTIPHHSQMETMHVCPSSIQAQLMGTISRINIYMPPLVYSRPLPCRRYRTIPHHSQMATMHVCPSSTSSYLALEHAGAGGWQRAKTKTLYKDTNSDISPIIPSNLSFMRMPPGES